MSPVPRTIKAGITPQDFDEILEGLPAKRFEFFANQQVQVKVKVKKGKTAQAKAFPQDDPPSGNGFTLSRLVINLQVPGGADAMELHVRAQLGETKLAYYFNEKWNPLDAQKSGDFLVAKVNNFPDDPSIGIGH